MLLRDRLSKLEGARLTGIGSLLLALGALITALGGHFLKQPTFFAGFLEGFGIVLMGTSIVFNCWGMRKIREERRYRQLD